jgi:hypothetical protein
VVRISVCAVVGGGGGGKEYARGAPFWKEREREYRHQRM